MGLRGLDAKTPSMFIQTEETPNPLTLKFLPGGAVMEEGTATFESVEESAPSPLAAALFALDGAQGVFFGADFVSVTKDEKADWDTLKAQVLMVMMEHFQAGAPLFHEGQEADTSLKDDIEEDEISRQIRALIDERVRPMVAMDGGDIVFDRFEEGIVYLHLRGACSGCPSASATLKIGVENMLKHHVPEVIEVRQVV